MFISQLGIVSKRLNLVPSRSRAMPTGKGDLDEFAQLFRNVADADTRQAGSLVPFFPGVRETSVSVDGLSLRCYDSNPDPAAESIPVVLLHGTAGSATNNFWALFPMLAMRHRILTFDFIDPPATHEQPSAASYVAQACAVIESLSVEQPVHLVGYSFGAVIAASLAARRADLVSSLVLVAGWIQTDRQQQLRNEVWQTLHSDHHPALNSFMALTAYSSAFLAGKSSLELEDLVRAIGDGPDRSTKMHFNRAVDLSGEVGSIVAPTLIIGCTEDQMVPVRHSRLLFGAIENARYAEIAAGHAVVHERPSELFNLIDRFVRDPKGSEPGSVLTSGHV